MEEAQDQAEALEEQEEEEDQEAMVPGVTAASLEMPMADALSP